MAQCRAAATRALDVILPHALAARLAAHCAATGDAALDVLVDAVALHLDGAELPHAEDAPALLAPVPDPAVQAVS